MGGGATGTRPNPLSAAALWPISSVIGKNLGGHIGQHSLAANFGGGGGANWPAQEKGGAFSWMDGGSRDGFKTVLNHL
jgi:hypothetical protein